MERRVLCAMALLVAVTVVSGRLLLARMLPAAALSAYGVVLEAGVATAVLLAVYLLGALHVLLGVAAAVLYTLLYIANLEMIAAMDTVVELQDAVFATHATFLHGSISGLQFALFGLLLAGVIVVYAVVAARVQQQRRLTPKRALVMTLTAVVLFGASGATAGGSAWHEHSVVVLSLHESLRRPYRAATASRDSVVHTANADASGVVARGDLTGELLLPRAEAAHNVLLLIVEGIPGVYLRQVQQQSGVGYAVQMPALSRLADSGLVATQSVAHARQTIRGLYSALTGDYPRLDLSTPKIYPYIEAPPDQRPAALAQTMRDIGYRTVYLQAAGLSYMSKDRFMPEAGFEDVLGKDFFDYSHVAFRWGPDDKAYFEQVADFIERLDAHSEPWFLTLLSVGTHHPYGVSDQYAEDYPSRKIAAVAYLDEALDEFFARLERDGYLDNTAVFLVSDESHGVSGHRFGRYWGTTVVWTPELQQPVLQNEVVGLRDLPITVLDYLGADDHASRFAGRSILRRYDSTRPMHFGRYIAKVVDAQTGLVIHSVPEGRRLQRFVPSSGALFAPHYETAHERVSELGELPQRLMAAYRAATLIPGVEYQLSDAGDPGEEELQPLHAADPHQQRWSLLQDAEYSVAAGKSLMLTSAQYLEIAPQTQVSLSLELEVAPINGAADVPVLQPSLQLMASYEEIDLDLPPMPELASGEAFKMRLHFSTAEVLERVWVDLRVHSLVSDSAVDLRVRSLILELEPLPEAEPGPEQGVNPQLERFDIYPLGSRSPAHALRQDLVTVAHAGGRYNETTYTNSLQALRANAARFNVFELDFEWTSDRRLIGLHDWDTIFERLYGFAAGEPLAYRELRQLESPLGVTPLDLDQLRDFLWRNPRAVIVTDVKRDNIRALQKIAERIDGHQRRIVPQLYHPEELGAVLELGYRNMIWTLYRYPGNRDSDRVVMQARDMQQRHGDVLVAVAMPAAIAEDGLAARLSEYGVHTYAHTVNSCSDYHRLRELGVDAIYSDDLAAGRCY